MNLGSEIAGAFRLSMGVDRLNLSLAAAMLLALLTAGCVIPTEEPTAPGKDNPQPHSTALYFVLDHVLDIDIAIAPMDWDALRYQTRTWEDAMTHFRTGCLAQPFEDIYSWFPAQVTVDGETVTNVGVRKKGFLGSLSIDKPSLKLRFDKYVDDQTLHDVMERMTLNNGIQDKSMINTCLAYHIFAEAGLPAPRCNFATVSVNDQDLGLYIHVEEIKPPFLERHFADSQGNLYEGTVSDFRSGWRGTFEKKTNEEANDWSDIDAVVAALEDPTSAGLVALDTIVDQDRFFSFWATEVLVGHWDGYAGNRNNYLFYRESDGPFIFIPWGVDQVFSLADDPNPFDEISRPPPSVLAHGAIAHRLYQDDAGRIAYVSRLHELLDTVWHEDDLLELADEMAAIVQTHALPEERTIAAQDTERVRQFIRERRSTVLDDLEPEPPAWPWPLAPDPCPVGQVTSGMETGAIELHFSTTWGSNQNPNPFEEGTVTYFLLNDTEQPGAGMAALAGTASPEETAGFGIEDAASLTIFGFGPDGLIEGFILVLSLAQLSGGTILSVEAGEVRGGYWSLPPGATEPDTFTPFVEGRLELIEAGTESGATISARFFGNFGTESALAADDTDALPTDITNTDDFGLVINEIAAQGEPLDWFELYNSSGSDLILADFVLADDLKDASKRIAFPADMVIPSGGYVQILLDKEGWPGFALGRDEELGIWSAEGVLVDAVDWEKGQADAGTSLARLPNGTGDFQTVSNPTPGTPN